MTLHERAPANTGMLRENNAEAEQDSSFLAVAFLAVLGLVLTMLLLKLDPAAVATLHMLS